MTELAVFDRPCDIAIVAGTAVLTINDLDHVYFIRTGLECEAQITVADLAAKTDAMKPVWKHYRPHASIFREFVDDDIAVFGLGSIRQCVGREGDNPNNRNERKA